MSDPMTNLEIEDVLSSIRRLVSEDLLPVPRTEQPAASHPPVQPSTGRLVLTPAFRVESEPLDADADFSDRDLAAMVAESTGGFAEDFGDAGKDADVLRFERRYHEATPEWPVEDDPADSSFDDIDLEDFAAANQLDLPDLDPDDEDIDPDWQPTEAALGPATDFAALEATISELEAAVAARKEEWEPDGSEPMAETPLTLLPSISDLFSAAARGFPKEPDAYTEPGRETPDPDVPEAVPVEAKAPDHAESVPESVRHEPVDLSVTPDALQPDPVAADAPGFQTSATPWRRLNLGSAVPPTDEQDALWFEDTSLPPEASADAAARSGETSLFDESDESILDEETLRDLVVDMIRQELQGALGERITRNVRKLVRAEIHRALSSREFD